jgi:hypothetical protein
VLHGRCVGNEIWAFEVRQSRSAPTATVQLYRRGWAMVKLARQRVGLFPSPTDDASRSRRGHSWWKSRQPGNVAGRWSSSLATVLSRVHKAVLHFLCTRIAHDTYPGSIGALPRTIKGT